MKKICLILMCAFVLIFSGCTGSIETNEPSSLNENEKQSLPVNFSLGKLEVSLKEIVETKKIEFNDDNTRITLDNKDGKYNTAIYTLKNNESYNIDIDHSVEVTILCDNEKIYYGDYYENKTGKENITIRPGEIKEVIFICDLDLSERFEKICFKYNNEEFNYVK